LGSGRQWLSWVHLADVVQAIRFASEEPRMKGIFNLSAEPVTNRQFATQLGKMMHRPSSLPLPGFILRVLLGEMSTIILDGQRISSKRLQQQGFAFQYPEIVSALKDLLK
jgi:NAD dependent epimerase/dehydratase family enzyme